jgi:hypothetical protein
MGLVSNAVVLISSLCAAIYAITKVVALMIVLRGSKPSERAVLVRALAELFRTGFWSCGGATTGSPRPPDRGRSSTTDKKTNGN